MEKFYVSQSQGISGNKCDTTTSDQGYGGFKCYLTNKKSYLSAPFIIFNSEYCLRRQNEDCCHLCLRIIPDTDKDADLESTGGEVAGYNAQSQNHAPGMNC